MEFKIKHTVVRTAVPSAVVGGAEFPAVEDWTWTLEMADGDVVCSGPRPFSSEKLARSQIASAKKSMKGAMRCKVVTVDDCQRQAERWAKIADELEAEQYKAVIKNAQR